MHLHRSTSEPFWARTSVPKGETRAQAGAWSISLGGRKYTVQKVIVKIETSTWRTTKGIAVQRTHHVFVSDLGGGKLVREVERYYRLTACELTELLEVFASEPTVGDPYLRVEQMQLAL